MVAYFVRQIGRRQMDRDAYVEKMKASIDDWNAQIANMQAQA